MRSIIGNLPHLNGNSGGHGLHRTEDAIGHGGGVPRDHQHRHGFANYSPHASMMEATIPDELAGITTFSKVSHLLAPNARLASL